MIPIINGVPMNVSALLQDIAGRLIVLKKDIEIGSLDLDAICHELGCIAAETLQALDLVEM